MIDKLYSYIIFVGLRVRLRNIFGMDFIRYLVNNRFTRSPIGGIGLEKADRCYEAIIGAVYVEKGFEEAETFVCLLLRTSKDFLEEFSDVLITCVAFLRE